ncbi:DUF3320 domain-containing protein [Telmatospirillum siberiense]|uniref:DNA helicase n=1 Tax=Telmatospirillum siberiense TaxID=382514 RepID=A0A2N3PLY6_9PROT|nr:DUF3320 domain-containing protein [Telmatospirillum siberiense]PKU21419.1 DNA helicase [Telmatospirillum siberiense]
MDAAESILKMESATLAATFCPRVSYAFHQNSIPVLMELSVSNETDRPLEEIEVSLSSEPPFIGARIWRMARVGANQSYHVPDLDLTLDGGMLSKLTEAETARVTVVASRDGAEIGRLETDVRLLARDQWGGAGAVPELLAAFVRPNDPAVDRILRKAAQILRGNGKDPALEGYGQGTRRRAWELISAVWGAVCGLGIEYSLPPASFESHGQKVRPPERIADGGVATCLDLALLFASCLEQCHLNPVVVLMSGHAAVGCWLVPEQFSDATVDDASALRKRIKLGELVLFETTLATQRPAPTFGTAAERGTKHVSEAEESKFHFAVDVRRARLQRILPLAAAGTPAIPGKAVEQVLASEPAFEEAPDLGDVATAKPTAENREMGRLERWQRKLLDLSLRNALLNFRSVKRCVTFDAPHPDDIAARIAQGSVLKILARPQVMEGSDTRDASIHLGRWNEDAKAAMAADALARDELFVGLTEEEMSARLTELFRFARNELQEGGANTLYLAMGFLSWRRGEEDKPCRAPLLLVPVKLERRSARSGFRVSAHDDEPRFNLTLLEMLRQDFELTIPAVEGELPKDGDISDVAAIWRAVGEAVKDIKGWEVVEEVALSTFSFSKYLMWKDLVERTDLLKENPVVRHLLDSPQEQFPSDIPFPDPRELDETCEPIVTFCPLPADSSQLAAVVAAARGKDFVLHGPPGTGKSQTIANLIAQCLADGRSVLFVAEKTVALNVVHRRLKDVKLGEFCLELHSNKANKHEVLGQLRQAWEAKGDVDRNIWAERAAKLKRLRSDLNAFVERLHLIRRNGMTAYHAIGRVVAGGDVAELDLSWPSPDAHDAEAVGKLAEIADRLDIDAKELGTISGHPLAAIGREEWSPGWQAALTGAARRLIPACGRLSSVAIGFVKAAGLPEVVLDVRGRAGLAGLAEALPAAAGRDWGFVLRPDARQIAERLREGADGLAERNRHASRLSVSYALNTVRSIDFDFLEETLATAGSTWWPRSAWLRSRVRKDLASRIETAAKPKAKPAMAEDLALLRGIRDVEMRLSALEDLAAKTCGLWAGLGTSVQEVSLAVDFHSRISSALANLATNIESLTSLRTVAARLLGEANALLEAVGPVGVAAATYLAAEADFREALSDFLAQSADCDAMPDADATPDSLLAECRDIIASEAKLRAWCAWRKARGEAAAAGLLPLVEGIESGAVPTGTIREALEVNYCRWWIGAVVDGDDVLRSFVPAEHEHKISEFKALDDKFTEMTKDLIRARLCASIPDADNGSRGSDWGILRREIQRKRGHMPLRQLIGSLPEAFPCLAPCLLMSPLSIAQYLTPEAHFDLVVFDEASQIPVWDAIGAMARAKHVVVVGDPKQLPPTNFFARGEDESDDDTADDAAMESILDECVAANLPSLRLVWHYRSRHESLIAFSNHRYYGGGLVTFPSPTTEDRAVSFHHVAEGVYEKGGSRTNVPEARALVGHIVARLKDPKFVASKLSVGIVTFNSEQQRLIEDMLDAERRKNPAIERHFDENLVEEIFVKNLESVQGDERDVMYFSVTFGPGRDGAAMSMNFGPINKPGGERRLNVAVTRARHELRVFSSFRPEQMDLGRTRAIGARDLKHFLEFADRGPRALAEAVYGSVGEFESPFEESVAAVLAARGWRVDPQIGVSRFRVDLGVVDPHAPGRYLAGVECDGATYHRSATARDRDKLREQVLVGLGWKILRIWSTEWWTDPRGAAEKIHVRLMALAEASKEELTKPEHDAAEGELGFPEPVEPMESQGEPVMPRVVPADRPQPDVIAVSGTDIYVEADATEAVPYVNPDAFYEPAYTAMVEAMVRHVVEAEGPIRDEILAMRIARAHGFQRTGSRIQEHVAKLATRIFGTTKEDVGTFFWPEGMEPGQCATFRRATGEIRRSVDDVSMPELEAIARHVFETELPEDPLVAIARVLNLQRLRAVSRSRLERAWNAACSRLL